jgi:hypothetical protein
MNVSETIEQLKSLDLKPLQSVEVVPDEPYPSIEDIELFFSECEKVNLIPSMMENGSFKVQCLQNATPIQIELAKLSEIDFKALQSLVTSASISTMIKGKHNAFRALFKRELKKGSSTLKPFFKKMIRCDDTQINKILNHF